MAEKKKRVLIVDDSFYMRTILKNILLDAGYDIVGEAENGKDALEKISDKIPDLVTLDMILPDKTGLEVLKGIKDLNRNIKVVMVSAVGQEAIITEAIAKGAEAYIVKPFKEDKVLKIVSSIFDNVSA